MPPTRYLYRNQHRSGSSGFTLIELLVVIVVIGVLASLVGPNVFRHVGAAKETTARSQIEMLGAEPLNSDLTLLTWVPSFPLVVATGSSTSYVFRPAELFFTRSFSARETRWLVA